MIVENLLWIAFGVLVGVAITSFLNSAKVTREQINLLTLRSDVAVLRYALALYVQNSTLNDTGAAQIARRIVENILEEE